MKKTIIIGRRKLSDSKTLKTLPPISQKCIPLQVLKEVSEPNTPGTPIDPNAKKKDIRKSRFCRVELLSDSSSDGSEHEVWNNDDLLLKGIHFGEFNKLSQTDELQMLYKLRYESHPNYREEISNFQVAQGTQQLVKKIKLHFLKYKTIIPLLDENDYSKPYQISEDYNYMEFWNYFLNRRNHRRHKQLVPMQAKHMSQSFIVKSESLNPIVRSTQKIKTQYRIRSLASRK